MVHFFAIDAPAGRRRRPGAPLHPRLHAGIGPPAGAAAPRSASSTALLALLALVIAAGTATTGAGPARRRRLGPAGRQAHPHRPARHGRAPLEPGPAAGRRHRRPRRGPPRGRRPRAGAALRAHPPGRAWWRRPRSGYTQYFTHLPALLVEVHIIGATALVIGAVQTFLACTYHAPEVLPAPLARDTSAPGVPIGAH